MIRNPASFIPNLFWPSNAPEFAAILMHPDPAALRRSELILRLHKVFPDLPRLVWCNEDTPFIWGQIIRTMGSIPFQQKIRGDFDLFCDIMPAKAVQKFQGYLEAHPSMNLFHFRRVLTAFAQKFAMTEAIIEELDAPNWDEKQVQTLTEIYSKDLEAIARTPKTDLILP